MAGINQFTSNFIDNDAADCGVKFVTKSYLIDVYPYLNGLGDIAMAGLWGCGANNYGALGDSTTVDKSSPVQTITMGTNWKQVASSNYYYSGHTAAVTTDGTLWLWGYNSVGQLGNSTSTDRSSPVQTIALGTNWKQVSCGDLYTTAIKTDGTLWTWGNNFYGQLGNSMSTDRSSPVQTIALGTNWKQVSAGKYHVGAIKTDGTLWLWGDGYIGQLGNSITTNKSSPVQTIALGTNWKQVACGYTHTSAIKTDGTLWGWGYNLFGQLGDSTTNNTSSPVQTITLGTNWKQISVGNHHTASIKTDGTLWLWGYNPYGQLGDSTQINKNSPVQTIALGTNWKQIACGYMGTGSIKTDGTLWLWGYDNYGQLGNSTTFATAISPVQTIALGTNWKYVALGNRDAFFIKEMGDDF